MDRLQMKNDIFRPVDFWKSAVMTMPDNSFYELLRSIFGKIKTPFNKQQLLNNLETFLLKADVQKTIAAFIDHTDAKIIAAAALFGEPVLNDLVSFFSDEYSYAQLQDIIVNLEERFILYRFTEEKPNVFRFSGISSGSQQTCTRLALNPVLKTVLLPVIADTSSLFPAASENNMPDTNETSEKTSLEPINELIIAALFSFVSRWDNFFKSEGVIRKQIVEEGKKIFPGIKLDNIFGALQILGLFYTDEDKLFPDIKCFNNFCLLSAQERMEYCAAALMVYNGLTLPSKILPPIYRSKILETVNLISNLLSLLNADSFYPEKTIKRIIDVLNAQTGTGVNTSTLIESMEKTGLITRTSSNMLHPGVITNTSAEKTKTGKEYKNPVIVTDSGSSILVYPEIDFSDVIMLASFLNVCQTGPVSENTVIRFELDRDSAVRAFDNNITADEIIKLLGRLACRQYTEVNADDPLIWNIKDWEKRHSDVSIKRGVILKLSEERQYLTGTYPLSLLITETLAPGLYLLNENKINDALSALRKAGIDIIANKKEKKETLLSSVNYFPTPSLSVSSRKNIVPSAANTTGKKPEPLQPDAGNPCDQVKSNFLTVLDKMSLSDAEKTELSARIERRLIICESQLKEASIRYEKLEARHMDYAGKQNIAKQAVSQQLPVEIVLQEKGKVKRIFGVPQALEKDGNEHILVIDPATANTDYDNNDQLRIPLAKISLLRRIKKSIFES